MLILSLLFFAYVMWLAIFEIEIEAKDGWAVGLPTWSRKDGFFSKWYARCMGGKPLTGYHLLWFPWVISVWCMIFYWWQKECADQSWQLGSTYLMLSLVFPLAVIWDFLWFVLNPYYGIKNFKKDKVWWRGTAWWPFDLFPIDYAVGLATSFVIMTVYGYVEGTWDYLILHAQVIGINLGLVVLTTVFLVPVYHRWYYWMRSK